MAFFSTIKALLLCTTSLSLLLTTPASGKGSNYLLGGEILKIGETLVEGANKLIMETDCNLVLYSSGTKKWSSNILGKPSGCYANLRNTGNLIIYDKNHTKRWEEGPNGSVGNYILVLESNSVFVIYGASSWSPIKNTYGSDDVVVATTFNGTTGVSGEEQNNVREMGKIMEVI